MTRIELGITLDPTQVEIVGNLIKHDGGVVRFSAVVDTGAEISLFPNNFRNEIVFRPKQNGRVEVEQAGIAKQSFEAEEGFAMLYFEDKHGSQTKTFEARVWFADTDQPLIGFADILDWAVLHIDMPARQAWLEIDA